MRLGLLGPADGDVDALARMAKLLVDVVRVDRAIYLGADDALDAAVAKLAGAVVEGDPSDDAAWTRAARVAIGGSPGDIDSYVRAEESRRRLRVLERLPDPKVSRTIEMVGDRVAVLLYDKGLLDEEDIFAASLLVFGKSDEPLVKKVGTRWFVTPGAIGCPGGGAAVLDDDSEEIVASIYDRDGKRTVHESIAIARATKMKVQGSL